MKKFPGGQDSSGHGVYAQHPALPPVPRYNTLSYNSIAQIGDPSNPCLTRAFQHIRRHLRRSSCLTILCQMDRVPHLFHSQLLTGALSWSQGLQAIPSPYELLIQQFLIILSPTSSILEFSTCTLPSLSLTPPPPTTSLFLLVILFTTSNKFPFASSLSNSSTNSWSKNLLFCSPLVAYSQLCK